MESSQSITQLLRAWSDGDQQALDELIPLVYGELRRIARCRRSSENVEIWTVADPFGLLFIAEGSPSAKARLRLSFNLVFPIIAAGWPPRSSD